ncbi:MAG: DedA family protein [Patescibacteria group bacterium]
MDVYNYIISFKYVAIFLGSFIEGPTVGLIVGFLSRVGYINLYWGYFAHVLGDFSADMIYYAIGFFGGAKVVPKMARIFKFSVEEVENLEKSFTKHSKKLIIVGKITHVIGFPILIAAGVIRYRWYKFVIFDFVATLIKASVLVFIGYHFGGLWEKVDSALLVITGVGLLVVVAQITFILVRRLMRVKNGEISIDKKEEERLLQRWKKRR